MTSTLPNFLTGPVASAAGSVVSNATALAGLMPAATDGDFAALLPAAPVVVAPAAATAVALPPGAGLRRNEQGGAMTETGTLPTVTFVTRGKPVRVSATAFALKHALVRPPEMSREEFEQAAAFAAVLMQTLQPAPATGLAGPDASTTTLTGQGGLTVAAQPAPGPGAAADQPAPAFSGGRISAPTVPDPIAASAGSESTVSGQLAPAVVTDEAAKPKQAPAPWTLPVGREFPTGPQAKASPVAGQPVRENLADQAMPFVTVGRPVPMESVSRSDLPVGSPPVPSGPAAAVPPSSSTAAVTVAADGVIELKLTLSPLREAGLTPGTQSASPFEVSAELEVPGQAVIRVETTVPEANHFAETARPVNFAGLSSPEKSRIDMPGDAPERNFVLSEGKGVKPESPKSGIAVAQTETTMSAAPTEEVRTHRTAENLSALPVRGDFQLNQPAAERIPTAPVEPTEQNFAERAVATVTGLAEAQFSASMHKTGSVQLRLKFGGEDLSVRVELRDGAVHTDFRTDSPALREAIAREWQAVASSSPGHLQRFLDPVFSPASGSASAEGGAQQHASQRQPSPQQQGQEQAASRQDGWAGSSPFSRRSALSESFVPEPAAPRVPVLLPTSLRLSALA